MQSKSIGDYIFFGMSIRFLQDAKAGWPVHGKRRICDNIRVVLDGLEEYGLTVTRRASSDLKLFLKYLDESGDDYKLSASDAKELSEHIRDLKKVLQAEGAGRIVYIVTDKRIAVDKLLSEVSRLLAPKVFDALPDIAKTDLEEAGKCIAFERSTAAAFHLLRATESALRKLYCDVVRQKSKQVDFMWGSMVKDLRKRRQSPPQALLDNLDNIRRNYRNPTQHPEKIYDIQEAQDLFGVCVDVINRMVSSPKWRT